MRALVWHADLFEYKLIEKESRVAERGEPGDGRSLTDLIVSLTTIEEGDGGREVDEMAGELMKIAREVGSNEVLIYPYAHLSNRLATPDEALRALELLTERLIGSGFEAFRAPFGWTKSFKVQVKGHALAEQLRVVEPKAEGEREERAPKEKFHRFIMIDEDGSEYEVTKEDWRRSPIFGRDDLRHRMLWTFVRNELEGKPSGGGPPRHIHHMRKLELVDYCPESDIGHMKWYPDGVLIRDLILDYAFFHIAKRWGAMKMQNPFLYRMDVESIRMLQGEFHERDYMMEGDDRKLVLRFASDPGAFPFVQKLVFTYKQMPLKIYEEAQCFRKEQRGELTGLMRVRNFLMTDHHAFCSSEEQAMNEYRTLSLLFKRLMDDVISGDYWILGFEFVESYYDRLRGYIKSLIKELGVPAFIKLMGKMSHYYAFKSEYQAVFPDGSNLQISTVQWDVKNGKRFNIHYVDEDGGERSVPIILHASSFGSIERALASILEKAAWDERNGLNPVLPFWLAPEQIRIIPVRIKDHLDIAMKLADAIEARGFRVGLDDRDLTLARRVHDAKIRWIPYIVIVGDKEMESGIYSVTPREGYAIGKEPQLKMTLEEMLDRLESRQGGMPRRPLYVPRELSRRPVFTGVK